MTDVTPMRHIQPPPGAEPTHKELTEAIEREIAAGKEASKRVPINSSKEVELSEAEAGREALKQRIKLAFAAATRDLDYAEAAIVEIDRAIAMHQLNREGLVTMRDEAKARIVSCRFGMARFA